MMSCLHEEGQTVVFVCCLRGSAALRKLNLIERAGIKKDSHVE